MATSPSTSNYAISKGKFYFTPAGGTERHLGNVSQATLTNNITFEDHFSSMAGVRSKDKTVATEISAEVSMTLDEITVENLALAVLGEVSDQTTGDPGYVDGATTQARKVEILKGTSFEGSLRFEGTNVEGVRVEMQLPNVSFKAGASFALISDSWNSLEVTADVLYDEASGTFGFIHELGTAVV